MKILLTSFNPQIFAKVLVFYVFKETSVTSVKATYGISISVAFCFLQSQLCQKLTVSNHFFFKLFLQQLKYIFFYSFL